MAALLDDAPVVRSEGQAFPVETRYLGRDPLKRIEDQVTDAVQGARSLDQQLAAANRARDAAQAALQLAQARYRAGLGTQIDVLTAQRQLLQLEQQTAALQAQRLAAAIDLDAALGGGLVLESPSSSLADASVTP